MSLKDSLRVGAVKSILEATAATEDDVHIVKKAALEKMMMSDVRTCLLLPQCTSSELEETLKSADLFCKL